MFWKRSLILGLLLLMLLGMVVAVCPTSSAAQETLRRTVARRLTRRWRGDRARDWALAHARFQAIAGDRPPLARRADPDPLPAPLLNAQVARSVPPLPTIGEASPDDSSVWVSPIPLYLTFCCLVI
jgi:hypothetical protein